MKLRKYGQNYDIKGEKVALIRTPNQKVGKYRMISI
jgi:hypothetical protein